MAERLEDVTDLDLLALMEILTKAPSPPPFRDEVLICLNELSLARASLSAAEKMAEALRGIENNEIAEALDAINTIHATLRHRQAPQDVTFHRGQKALRDAGNKARTALADFESSRDHRRDE